MRKKSYFTFNRSKVELNHGFADISGFSVRKLFRLSSFSFHFSFYNYRRQRRSRAKSRDYMFIQFSNSCSGQWLEFTGAQVLKASLSRKYFSERKKIIFSDMSLHRAPTTGDTR